MTKMPGYVYTADSFQVRIRINAKAMATFRASAEGRAAERHVDVLDQGFGWWQITSREEPCKLTGLPAWARAHFNWIAELNKVGRVVTAPATQTVVSRKVFREVRMIEAADRKIIAHRVSPEKLNALVQRFH